MLWCLCSCGCFVTGFNELCVHRLYALRQSRTSSAECVSGSQVQAARTRMWMCLVYYTAGAPIAGSGKPIYPQRIALLLDCVGLCRWPQRDWVQRGCRGDAAIEHMYIKTTQHYAVTFWVWSWNAWCVKQRSIAKPLRQYWELVSQNMMYKRVQLDRNSDVSDVITT